MLIALISMEILHCMKLSRYELFAAASGVTNFIQAHNKNSKSNNSNLVSIAQFLVSNGADLNAKNMVRSPLYLPYRTSLTVHTSTVTVVRSLIVILE